MSIDDDVQAALAAPYTGGGEVVRGGLRAKIVYSARIPAELSDEIADAAAVAAVTPSAMIATLVEEALRARRANPSRVVTVDLAELHRAIDQAARAA